MNELLRLKYFIQYQWQAKTKYYLHSPFVYQFYLNVLEDKDDVQLMALNNLRNKLSTDHSLVQVQDFGTGTSVAKTISAIESTVAVRPKYGRLLYRLVQYFNPKNILELGGSMGLSAAYMAFANKQAAITSLEGAPGVLQLAKKNHALLGLTNIQWMEGAFDETLPVVLKDLPKLDLVFFDGNHKKEATIQYFHQCLESAHTESVFIFDDIHWSSEMNEAWTEIKAHPHITLAIDVFQFGICFFKKEKLAKEEFILRY